MRNYQIVFLACFLFAASCAGYPGNAEQALSDLDDAYVEAWKQNGTAMQTSAVLALFTENAIIMPGRGGDARQGKHALKEFWFPEDTPPTNVSKFKHLITGVDMENNLGVVYGRYELHFEFDGQDYARIGNYQSIARRQPDHNWRFTQMIWNDKAIDE